MRIVDIDRRRSNDCTVHQRTLERSKDSSSCSVDEYGTTTYIIRYGVPITGLTEEETFVEVCSMVLRMTYNEKEYYCYFVRAIFPCNNCLPLRAVALSKIIESSRYVDIEVEWCVLNFELTY